MFCLCWIFFLHIFTSGTNRTRVCCKCWYFPVEEIIKRVIALEWTNLLCGPRGHHFSKQWNIRVDANPAGVTYCIGRLNYLIFLFLLFFCSISIYLSNSAALFDSGSWNKFLLCSTFVRESGSTDGPSWSRSQEGIVDLIFFCFVFKNRCIQPTVFMCVHLCVFITSVLVSESTDAGWF